GPGCLNYALVLGIDENGPLRSISAANRFIMDRNRAALESLSAPGGHDAQGPSSKSENRKPKSPIAVRGHTDLPIDGFKFSGNSQRRRRRFLLFHGSFLLQADIALISEVMPLPSKQPDYRRNRSHAAFLANLNIPADEVKTALKSAWQADSILD